MASAIFSAIGRGYSARSILSAIGRKAPRYANTISTAYYAGYAAEQILSRIASKKDGKNYDPKLFMTAHERTRKNEQDTKRNNLLKVLASAGTLAAAGVGIYALMQRGKAIQASQIIMPERAQLTGKPGKEGATFYGGSKPGPKQITNQQKLLPAPRNPSNPNPNAPSSPQGPLMPLGGHPNQPQTQQQNQPIHNPPSPTQANNVKMVRSLQEERLFKDIVEGGYDEKINELILRSVLPRDIIGIMDKAEGGLEQVIKDFSSYMQGNQAPSQNLNEMPQESNALEPQQEPPMQQAQQTQQSPEMMQPQAPPQQQQITPQQQVQKPVAQQIQEMDQNIPQKRETNEPMSPPIQRPTDRHAPTKPRLASLMNGEIGEIKEIKHGVVTLDINGKERKVKASEITMEDPELEGAIRKTLDSIPEELKSSNIQSSTYVPQIELMLNQHYSGEMYWYLGVPEEDYLAVSLGTFAPKGEAVTGIAKYNPKVKDSRGAGNSELITQNPRFSKENEGITWGKAKNEYSILHTIQKTLNKISKERYDEHGNLIQTKPRKKK